MRIVTPAVLGMAFIIQPAPLLGQSSSKPDMTKPSIAALDGLPSAFDVAVIRQNIAPRGRPRIISSPFDGSFIASYATLKMLLGYAYNLPQTQVLGGPDWLGSTKFEVQAKTDDAVGDRLHNLASGQGKQEKQQMLKSLLADRFKLTAHQETRNLSVFTLIVAKNGPKLDKSEEANPIVRGWYGHLTVEGGEDTLTNFADELSKRVGRIVLDKTGIKGRYSIDLDWSDDDDPGDDAPSIFTAIREQLGLRLESHKAPIQILVIDHVEMPSEN